MPSALVLVVFAVGNAVGAPPDAMDEDEDEDEDKDEDTAAAAVRSVSDGFLTSSDLLGSLLAFAAVYSGVS